MEILSGYYTKKCSVVLERLDEKSLKKCLQKHGLKLATQSSVKRPSGNNRNSYRRRSRTKKSVHSSRKKRNSDDFTEEIALRNCKRRRRIKPLVYTDDESSSEKTEIPEDINKRSQAFSDLEHNHDLLNESYKEEVKSKREVGSDKMLISEDLREGGVALVSPNSKILEDREKDREKSTPQLKHAILLEQEDVCCGGTGRLQDSGTAEILQICEKPCSKESTASFIDKKGQLTGLTHATGFEEDECDSRQDSEDERNTVIFEEELHKDTDLEDIFEFEENDNKIFNNREITNRKRQRMVKFKRKSMGGRNLAKVERKPKNKSVEGPGNEQDVCEKSTDGVSEDCLKEVCCLVKRLHELSRIIFLLQRELPRNDELSVHFNRVINAQQENFHREIRKGQKTIIKCYEKMLNFYSDTSQVALEIGKRTSLSVEDVVNIISLCILIEGRCEVEKSITGGKQGMFAPANLSDGLQKIISDNIVRIIKKKISQLEDLNQKHEMIKNSTISSTQPNNQPKQHKVTNGISSPISKFGAQQKHQFLNLTGSPTLQRTTQQKQKKVMNTAGSPVSQLSSQLKKQVTNNSPGVQSSQYNIQLKQQLVNSRDHIRERQEAVNSSSFPSSQRDIQSKRQKVTKNAGFPLSQPNNQQRHNTIKNTICVSNSQHNIQHKQVLNSCTTFPSSHPNIQKKQQTDNSLGSSDDLRNNKASLLESIRLPPKQQIGNNVSGSVHSQYSFPTVNINHRPQSCHQPYERVLKSTTKGGEETAQSSNRVAPPCMNPQIPEKHKPFPQGSVLTPGETIPGLNQGNQFLVNTVLRYPTPQGPVQDQPAVADRTLYYLIPPQSSRYTQACILEPTTGISPQKNVRFAISEISHIASPVLVTLPGYNLPVNKMLETNRNPTATVRAASKSQNSATQSGLNKTCGGLSGSKQVATASETQCPLKNGKVTLSIKILDNNTGFTIPMHLSERNNSSMTQVANSEVQEILDPTIPQKLTMRNSRLQAGPVLEITDTKKPSEETKNAGKEVKDLDRENSQPRVYFCAQNGCKNPGVRICNGCRSIIYCSEACQYAHWKLKHKTECYQLQALRG